MSTRVMVRGKTVFATPDFWREERSRQRFEHERRAVQRLVRDLEDSPPAPEFRSQSIRGVPVYDPSSGITYREIHTLNAIDGWVTAETVMRWYKLPDFKTVAAWVRAGLLDAAFESTSPTRRFRVLAPDACQREAEKVAALPSNEKKRPRRRAT
jgi:hypothetical protein